MGAPAGEVGRYPIVCRDGGLDGAEGFQAMTNQTNREQNQNQNRSLAAIAREIRRDWRNPYFGAVPYLDAMGCLEKIEDPYFQDSGESIVAYFLGNASTWRGDVAKRIKAELKAMLPKRRR